MATWRETQSSVFDDAAHDFARIRGWFWDVVAQGTLARSAPALGEKVLDACCGDGASAVPTAVAVGREGGVDAVDVSAELLAILRGRSSHLPWLRAFEHDVMQWSPAPTYDLVQCVLGVFFLPDMEAGTRHLVSLARPGGRVAITIWRRGAIEPLGEALAEARRSVRPDQAHDVPRAESAPHLISQVNTVDSMAGWLGQLDLREVCVSEAELSIPLNEGRAWEIVLGSGYRAALQDLSLQERALLRERLEGVLASNGLRNLDATTLVGTGVRA